MKPTKPISDWKKIFLDTSIILDYISKPDGREVGVAKRIQTVHKLMELLGDDKHPVSGRAFYISSITVGEIHDIGRQQSIKDIIEIFQAANIVFVDFTKDVALLMNNSLRNATPPDQFKAWHEGLKSEFRKNGPANVSARRWISDDMKIVATAKSVRGLDVILTSDHSTFGKIADRQNLPCLCLGKDELPADMFGEIDTLQHF